MPESFINAMMGGALIGVAASILLITQGRIAGISGIVGGLLSPAPNETRWRLHFLLGLGLGALLIWSTLPESIAAPNGRSIPQLVVAGLLVGFGTRLGNGCTSGHGVCGLSRRSPRSLFSTLTFMGTGFGTATLMGALFGVS